MEKLLMLYRAATLLAPIARQGMELAQAMLPEKGQGAARLEFVRAHVKAAVEELKLIEAKFEEVWPVLARSISAAVPVLKTLGILKETAAITAAVDAISAAPGLFKTAQGTAAAGT